MAAGSRISSEKSGSLSFSVGNGKVNLSLLMCSLFGCSCCSWGASNIFSLFSLSTLSIRIFFLSSSSIFSWLSSSRPSKKVWMRLVASGWALARSSSIYLPKTCNPWIIIRADSSPLNCGSIPASLVLNCLRVESFISHSSSRTAFLRNVIGWVSARSRLSPISSCASTSLPGRSVACLACWSI